MYFHENLEIYQDPNSLPEGPIYIQFHQPRSRPELKYKDVEQRSQPGVMLFVQFELLWTNCGPEFTHSVESLQDLQSSGIDKVHSDKEKFMLDCLKVESPIPVPIRRKLAESNCKETPKLKGQTLDIGPVPFAVSKAETDESGMTNTTIIIAVVSTSVVTFLSLSTSECSNKFLFKS